MPGRGSMLAALVLGAAAMPAAAEDRALLIGINSYPNRPLNGPLNDVALMREVATKELAFAPAQVRVLDETAATKAGILDAIDAWLVAGTGPGDRALFYFSGHGTQIDDLDADEVDDRLDEALVAIDYDPDSPRDGLVIDDEIAAALSRLADRNVTLVVDACYSGTIARAFGEPGEIAATARFMPPPASAISGSRAFFAEGSAESRKAARQDGGIGDRSAQLGRQDVWTAAAPYQLAWETQIGGRSHGVFTRSLHDGLVGKAADANGNGVVSRQELLDFATTNAATFCDGAAECAGREAGFTPTLEVAPELRALVVAAWPEDAPPAPEPVDAPVPAPTPPAPTPVPAAPPTVQQMLDVLVGGRNDLSLDLTHYDRAASGPVRAGDQVAFEIASATDGDVLLFDLREGGLVHQLFPSARFAKNTPITAGTPMRIPDAYTNVAFPLPPGQGTLVAIVVQDRGLVDELARQNLAMTPIKDPLAFFGSLMGALSGVYTGDAENRSVRFGLATLPYEARS